MMRIGKTAADCFLARDAAGTGRRLLPVILAAALLLALAGCAGGGGKHGGGGFRGIGGAVDGAIIKGNDIWWRAAGLGALTELPEGGGDDYWFGPEDRKTSLRTSINAFENLADRKAARWAGTAGGTGGYMKPLSTADNGNGKTCREFEAGVTLDGQSTAATGTACRQADGTWKIRR